MPCYLTKASDGRVIRLCGENLLLPVCADCGLVADILCDYPVGDGVTCDRSVCEDHAHEVADGIHYCAAHHKRWAEWAREHDVVTAPHWNPPESTNQKTPSGREEE